MSKRTGGELPNSSKRVKVDNDMPPPRFAPPQKPNLNFNLKPQASVTDPKPPNALDDDSDEEDIWIQASQIEEQVLGVPRGGGATQFDDGITYSDFRMADCFTSTQQAPVGIQCVPVIDLTGNGGSTVKPDPKVQILQNRCAALEKQLKKFRPSSAAMSQRSNEMSELRERIKKLASENDELRNEKLRNDVESVSSGDLKRENEQLKKAIEQLVMERKNGTNGRREDMQTARESPRLNQSSNKNDQRQPEASTSAAQGADQKLPQDQPIGAENPTVTQVKSDYKPRKMSVWKSDTIEPQETDDSIIIDLIKKTESFNIFNGKRETLEDLYMRRVIEDTKTALNVEKSHLIPTLPEQSTDNQDLPRTRSLKPTTQLPKPQSTAQFDLVKPTITKSPPIIEESPEISALKLLITRMQMRVMHEATTSDIVAIFNEILGIFTRISASVREVERRRWNEHFMKQEFACKQAQYFSEQHFADRQFKTTMRCDEADLLGHEKLFEDEWRVEERRMVALVSVICRNSPELSEMLLTQNISGITGSFRTVIDEICDTIDPYILQSRLLYRNSGLTMALCEMLCSLASHYGRFARGSGMVDAMLLKLFNHLLTMSTNSAKILTRHSRFLVSVARGPDFGIVSRFCMNFPSSNLEFSKIFKIYQIPRSGCLLQIYFCLLASVFRYTESVEEHMTEDLIELAIELNTLVDILLANADKLEFLNPQVSDDSKSGCNCYKFLTIALLTLNEQVLRHRNHGCEKHLYRLRRIAKSAVINITKLLALTRKTVAFWSFNFGHNLMNDINMRIKFDQICIDDKLFPCKDVLLVGSKHDMFLKRLRVRTNFQDEELSLLELSQAEVELNNSIKDKNNAFKSALMEESMECFKKERTQSNLS